MSTSEKQELIQQVNTALDSIRPHLAADGGDVEVVDITPGMEVQIKWMGNCKGCSMSGMTMKGGIEATLKSALPQIKGVVALNGVA